METTTQLNNQEQSAIPKKIRGIKDPMNLDELLKYDSSWRTQASCRNHPNYNLEDYFYPSVSKKNIDKVLAINEMCRKCPVAPNCLQEAMIFNYDGLWAGTTLKQRRVYIRYIRNSTVEDLTVEECKQILQGLKKFDEENPAQSSQYNKKSHHSKYIKFLNTKNQQQQSSQER